MDGPTWSRRAWLVLVSLGVLWLACGIWSITASVLIDRAAEGRVWTSVAQVPARQTAIVLGARVYEDGTLSAILSDRVACALSLYRAGKVSRILVSGDHGKQRYDEVNAMADELTNAGVDARFVFRDHAGFRTLDTMQRAHEVFGVKSAIVCTQQFHLPRSLYLASHFGIDAVGLAADRRDYPSALHSALRERMANASALLDVTLGRSAHFLGAPHPIEGDGRSTRDQPPAEVR